MPVRLAWGGLHRVVSRTLRFASRGGVRHDRLEVIHVSGQLCIEWQARGVHPWDRRLSVHQQAQSFGEQLFTDTEKAVVSLFAAMPEVEAVTVRVVAPEDRRRVLLTGTVTRHDLAALQPQTSSRMRLWMWGLRPSDLTA